MGAYALLIQKYTLDLQFNLFTTGHHLGGVREQLRKDYDIKMNRLYNRLQKYHNISEKKFIQLKEQAMTF
jgi:hypothetical protein